MIVNISPRSSIHVACGVYLFGFMLRVEFICFHYFEDFYINCLCVYVLVDVPVLRTSQSRAYSKFI